MTVRRAALGLAVVCLALAGCTAAPLPTPTVAPVKNPAEMSSPEVATAMNDCVRDKGWDVVGGRTSTLYVGPPEQQTAFDEDLMQCYEDLGFDKLKPAEYTPEYLAKKYGQEQETRACLIGQGEEVPELPSLQAYTDMFFLDGKVYTSYESISGARTVSDPLRAICGDPLETWGADVDR